MNDPAIIDEMLRTAQTIAVVGLSDKTWRASHNIGRYLVMQGYHVIPVNPGLSEVLGLKCYPTLEAAQAAAQSRAPKRCRTIDLSEYLIRLSNTAQTEEVIDILPASFFRDSLSSRLSIR